MTKHRLEPTAADASNDQGNPKRRQTMHQSRVAIFPDIDDNAIDREDLCAAIETFMCHELDGNAVDYVLRVHMASESFESLYSECWKFIHPSVINLQALRKIELYELHASKLPVNIGKLTNLNTLWLEAKFLPSLPSSIGQLKNLKKLCLYNAISLLTLPAEIGDLANLCTLRLRYSSIVSLPDSVGQLQNLKELELSLSALPDEIGNLANLNKLDLGGSTITCLPRSIGKLQNLEKLYLNHTPNLSKLPDELFDNLANLNKLDLGGSTITCLPRSIGKLQNLEKLYLNHTPNLSKLPNELFDLINLNYLWFGDRALPDSMGRLTSLAHLVLESSISGQSCWRDHISKTARCCHSLEEIDVFFHGRKWRSPLNLSEKANIGFALACNRARSRLGSNTGSQSHDGVGTFLPGLWPMVLVRATNTFARNYQYNALASEKLASFYETKQSDAIHQLLLEHRESFVCLIMDRMRKMYSESGDE